MIRYWNGILFTILWTLGMMVWSWPLTTAHAIILTVCGVLAGAAFHFAMQWIGQRQSRSS
jgi:hypothetical protein